MLVARVDADLRLVECRILRTTPYSLVADLVVEGKDLPPSAAEWRLSGLGMRHVVVKRLPPRRPVQLSKAPVTPDARHSTPARHLSSTEQRLWADRTRRATPAPHASSPHTSGGNPASSSSASVSAPSPKVTDEPSEDVEIRVRRRAHPKLVTAASSCSPSSQASASAAASTSSAPRRPGGIQTFMKPAMKPSLKGPPLSS